METKFLQLETDVLRQYLFKLNAKQMRKLILMHQEIAKKLFATYGEEELLKFLNEEEIELINKYKDRSMLKLAQLFAKADTNELSNIIMTAHRVYKQLEVS